MILLSTILSIIAFISPDSSINTTETTETISELNIEGLISDLAFILILGAVVTVLFKWLKQPVVLGYIVAGFLASPHFEYLPSVTTISNIDFWAQIGIVVLLFSLGLEFSFKKLINVGGSAVVTALIIVSGMMCAGFAIGHVLGFSNINSLFLGGMLSMSSTTIIIKALTDLNLKQKKFASMIFAVLIVEDLFAVLMMVVLSSIAINNSVEGSEMLFSIGKLGFFLIIWFLVGVFVLPSALGKARKFLNNETLLIISMGLCLGMAVFSVYCGFSLALGAFVMGSILAGTSYAERIEHVVAPVKDLFGAVFFISVGMMVNPTIIVQYWSPILILSIVVILGMIIFGTFGMLITGQPLRIAIQSGFALTQIGEFAFIIASLGMALGVLDTNIYPIVVAVSVLTTFTTPYFIRMADPIYNQIERHLPKRLHFLIERYSKQAASESETTALWKSILQRYIWRIMLYSIVIIAIILVATQWLLPTFVGWFPSWGRFLCAVIAIVAMSPFLLALSTPSSKKVERRRLREANAHFDVPLVVMTILRPLLALCFVVYTISVLYSIVAGFIFGFIIFAVLIMFLSKKLRRQMHEIESKFFDNLNERELRRTGKNNNLISDLHLAYMEIGYNCPFVGQRLIDSDLRRRYGVNISSIQRGTHTILVPKGETRLFPGDILGVIGNDEQIQQLSDTIGNPHEEHDASPTDISDIKFTSIQLSESSPLVGKNSATSRIREDYSALLVAIQHPDGSFQMPDGTCQFNAHDILWLVGNPKVLSQLK